MTVVSFIDSTDPNFDPNNYSESYSYNSEIKTEDVNTHIETYDVTNDTISLDFRFGDYLDFVQTYYVEYDWYNLIVVDDDIWDYILSFSVPSAVRSDFYFYRSFYTINIVQFNQVSESYYAWDGNDSWTADPEAFTAYAIKLISTTVTK